MAKLTKQNKPAPAAEPKTEPETTPSQHRTGVTIHAEDETRFLDLTPDEVNCMLELAQASERLPEKRDPFTKEEAEERRQRRAQHEEPVDAFAQQLKRLAALDPLDLSLVFALVELIEFGEGGMAGGSWVLAFITGLLHDVIYEGPAKANEADPLNVLSHLAEHLRTYWSWIDDGERLRKRHPSLYLSLMLSANRQSRKEAN